MLHQSLQSSQTLGQFFERLYVLLLTVLCLLIGADLADRLPIWDATWDCGLMVA